MKQLKMKKELMKFLYKLIVPILLISTIAFAEGNKVGNGGNTVVCETEKETTVTLLDFYEDTISYSSTETSPYTIAENVFDKLKLIAPKLHKLYVKRLNQISNEIDFKDGVLLNEIKDSNHLFEPADKNCKVHQTAIRKAKIVGKEKQFVFRNDLWVKMSPLNQAGLLTHEIIYEHVSKLAEKNSIKARKLNRYLYQNSFTADEFWKFMKELEIPIYP